MCGCGLVDQYNASHEVSDCATLKVSPQIRRSAVSEGESDKVFDGIQGGRMAPKSLFGEPAPPKSPDHGDDNNYSPHPAIACNDVAHQMMAREMVRLPMPLANSGVKKRVQGACWSHLKVPRLHTCTLPLPESHGTGFHPPVWYAGLYNT
jgi:hypothetical protein